MNEPKCPACPARRDRRLLLCNRCWRQLPATTRGRLALHDPRMYGRREQLNRALAAHTPLAIIRVSR
ncbi:hypothetical protein [Streptomyces sp. NPDC048242]|uniref:hypothetical protein n=1 Tax=Streptomyces sp. NPDC048242 TaxID=3155026 RepID=UPI00341F241C